MTKPRVYLYHAHNCPGGRYELWRCHIDDIWASIMGSGHTPKEAYLDWLRKGGNK